MQHIEFRDLKYTKEDISLLSSFYYGLYSDGFPIKDERETFDNIVLALKNNGKSGANYLVTLVYNNDELIGGGIADYFAQSNCGVIEFLTVSSQTRKLGVGTLLHKYLVQWVSDCANMYGQYLQYLMAEIHDPLKIDHTDNFDGYQRLALADMLGYRKIDLSYIQTNLSEEQLPVDNLLLIAIAMTPLSVSKISSKTVLAFLYDYFYHAMRINKPEDNKHFLIMQQYLEEQDVLKLEHLV